MDKKNLGRLISCCGKMVKLNVDAELRRSGYNVTPVQSQALVYLYRHREENVTQRDLERALELKPSTINGIVERLLEKEYISRCTCPTDGRCRLLHLTEAGEAMVDSFRTALNRTDEAVLADLTEEEQDLLYALLRRIHANLETEVNKP